MIGEETTPTSSVAVSDHWAALSETESSAATSGSSGAPRLLTIETTSVVTTSTGTSARVPAAGGRKSGGDTPEP